VLVCGEPIAPAGTAVAVRETGVRWYDISSVDEQCNGGGGGGEWQIAKQKASVSSWQVQALQEVLFHRRL